MKVWIVVSGAYENSGPERVFSSLDLANAYVAEQEAAAALNPRHCMDDCWSVYGREGYEVDGDEE